MRKQSVVATIGICGLLMAVPCAQAATVWLKSKVIEINASSDYFKAYYLDPQTNKTEAVTIAVASSTRFEGVGSLRDLKVDDEVSIQANYDGFTHEWSAILVAFVAIPEAV